tara:strand:- start:30875 stop:34666 length:3792 start_codon:yes stop_codon:yes gene_type:complete
MVSVNPGNDAFGGGALVRSAPPTSGPQGALPALSGIPGGGPVGGVNPPGQPFFARPNEGTNVRIPYARVVPLSDPRGGGLRKTETAQNYYDANGGRDFTNPGYHKDVMSETDTLHPGRLAFVLAKRSGGRDYTVKGGNLIGGGGPGNAGATLTQDISYAVNSTMAPQLPGADRFQKLCSYEYLDRYVHTTVNVAKGAVIQLGEGAARLPTDNMTNLTQGWTKGLLRQLTERAIDRVRILGRKTSDETPAGAPRNAMQGAIDAATNPPGNLVAVDAALKEALLARIRHATNNAGAAPLAAAAYAASVRKKKEAIDAVATTPGATGGGGNPMGDDGYYEPGDKVLGYTGLPEPDATLLNIGDLAKQAGEFGSPVNADPTGDPYLTTNDFTVYDVALIEPSANGAPPKVHDKHPTRAQGIFTMDTSAFLRGRGIESEFVEASTTTKHGRGYPFGVSRNLGDEVAFAVLEQELVKLGLFDWTPDGILLSKLDNVPQDTLEDQRIDARDGMLYNLSIQGPCLATNWTGRTEMAVMPMDKVFVVVVADLWHSRYNTGSANSTLGANTINVLPQSPSTPLYMQIMQLLYPTSRSASPFVLRQMRDLLKNTDGSYPGESERPYDDAAYDKFTQSTVMVSLNEGDAAGKYGVMTGADGWNLEAKLQALRTFGEDDRNAFLERFTSRASTTGMQPTGKTTDFSGAALGWTLISLFNGILQAMTAVDVPEALKEDVLASVGMTSSGQPAITGPQTRYVIAVGPSTDDPKIATSLRAQNWFPLPFKGSGAKLELTEPYAKLPVADLKVKIELFYTNVIAPLLSITAIGVFQQAVLKRLVGNQDANPRIGEPLGSLYKPVVSEDVVEAGGVTITPLMRYRYTLALFDNVSPRGHKWLALGPDGVTAARDLLVARFRDNISEDPNASRIAYQRKLQGGRIYKYVDAAGETYQLMETFATVKMAGNVNVTHAVSAWLRQDNDATYEAYAAAKKKIVETYRLTSPAKGGGVFDDAMTARELADPNQGNNLIATELAGSFANFQAEAAKELTRTGKAGEGALRRTLTNFRLRLTTSSEMIANSGIAFDSNGVQTGKSRMGLAISNRCNESIVGGWCIGTVMDSAASRASGTLGANVGVRTAPNTAAHSVHVNIEWWNGDRLYRNYANVEGEFGGLTRPRHVAPKVLVPPGGGRNFEGDRGTSTLPTDLSFTDPRDGAPQPITFKFGPEMAVNRPFEAVFEDPLTNVTVLPPGADAAGHPAPVTGPMARDQRKLKTIGSRY